MTDVQVPMTLLALTIWFGVIGACVGSFCNVLIYRLPIMLRVGPFSDGSKLKEMTELHGKFTLSVPRSSCPCCDVPIRPWHNVPVLGWVSLKGRCYTCSSSISKQYVFVELLMGVSWGTVAYLTGVTIDSLIMILMGTLAFCIARIRAQTGVLIARLWVAFLVLACSHFVLSVISFNSLQG